jgi:hypothetical protein
MHILRFALLITFTMLFGIADITHAQGPLKVIELKEPWVGMLEDITVPTKFVVKAPIDGYAVEIRGNYRTEAPFNRYDGYLPRVVVECNYLSRGVHLRLIDNAVIDALQIHQANGTGLHAEGIRQSHLRSIWVTECDSDKEPAVDFVNIDRDKADASNGCTIDHLQVLACSNPTYLHLVGKPGQPTRNMQFGTVFLHTPWDHLRTMKHPNPKVFEPRPARELFVIEYASRCFIDALNLRLDHKYLGGGTAMRLGQYVRNCSFRGQALKEDPHTFLKGDVGDNRFDIVINRTLFRPSSQ